MCAFFCSTRKDLVFKGLHPTAGQGRQVRGLGGAKAAVVVVAVVVVVGDGVVGGVAVIVAVVVRVNIYDKLGQHSPR